MKVGDSLAMNWPKFEVSVSVKNTVSAESLNKRLKRTS